MDAAEDLRATASASESTPLLSATARHATAVSAANGSCLSSSDSQSSTVVVTNDEEPRGRIDPSKPPTASSTRPAILASLLRLHKRIAPSTPHSIPRFLASLMFLLNFLATLATVPMLRLIEDVLCRMHFSLPLAPGGAIHAPQRPPEVLCKSSVEVQAALAWTTGASVAVLSAVGLVSALPWGAASDRWGRRPVFWVSYVGILLGMLWSATVLRWPSVFSVRAVVLAPLGNLLGGGPQSMIACVFSAIADVTKADERATSFFLIAVTLMISGVLGLVVASTLMTIDPWIPLLLTLGSTPLTALLVSFMPETLLAEEVSLDGRASAADDETGPLQGADVSSAETPALGRAAKGHAAHLLRSMLAALRLPLRQPSLLLLLSNYLIQAQFGVGDTSILVQYLSMRFQYTLARAALLLAACGSASVLMLVVLPAASRALAARSQAPTTQSPTAGSGPGEARGGEDEAVPAQSDSRSLSPFNRDRVLACASIAVAAVSSVLMGTGDLRLVVGGMLFGALGDGWGALVRSMATAFVPAEYNSRLAGLINMTDTVGGIIAGPSMALFFEMGLRRRGVWFGLPYFWLAFLAVWAFVALCFVRDPTAKKALDEEGSTEESQGLVDATVI